MSGRRHREKHHHAQGQRLTFFALALASALELTWETAQLPWYGGWGVVPWYRLAFYVGLGTGGDLVTLASAYALMAWVCRDWRFFRHSPAACLGFTLLGLTYTLGSEYFNVYVLHRWTYAPAMPVMPIIGTGLAPLLQWLLLPPVLIWMMRQLDRRWLKLND